MPIPITPMFTWSFALCFFVGLELTSSTIFPVPAERIDGAAPVMIAVLIAFFKKVRLEFEEMVVIA
jgi:hypothetical protein